MAYDGTGTATSTFKTTATETNCTVDTSPDNNTTYVTYDPVTAVTPDSTSSQISYAIVGKDSEGSDFSITKVQTFSISKAGVTPSAGADARAIILTPNQHTITYLTDDTESDTITFTTDTQGTVGTRTYQFLVGGEERLAASEISIFTLADFTDATCDYNDDPTILHDANANIKVGMRVIGNGIPADATVSSITSPTVFELSAATTGGELTDQTLQFIDEPPIGGQVAVKVVLLDAGVEKANDTVTIYAIQDGSSTVNGFLTNAAHTVTAAVDESVASFSGAGGDRKSTRLNSSHVVISYAVFCLKKKKLVILQIL